MVSVVNSKIYIAHQIHWANVCIFGGKHQALFTIRTENQNKKRKKKWMTISRFKKKKKKKLLNILFKEAKRCNLPPPPPLPSLTHAHTHARTDARLHAHTHTHTHTHIDTHTPHTHRKLGKIGSNLPATWPYCAKRRLKFPISCKEIIIINRRRRGKRPLRIDERRNVSIGGQVTLAWRYKHTVSLSVSCSGISWVSQQLLSPAIIL